MAMIGVNHGGDAVAQVVRDAMLAEAATVMRPDQGFPSWRQGMP
jgi:hypothetical protein